MTRERPKSANFSHKPTVLAETATSRLRKAEKDAPAPVYQVKYDSVEKRSLSRVSMGSEVDARRSTQQRVAQKPGVLKTLQDLADATRTTQAVYGPQLPVQWVPDKPALRKKMRRRRNDGGSFSDGEGDDLSDGYDSPGTQALQLLEGGSALLSALVGNNNKRKKLTAAAADTTDAFLQARSLGRRSCGVKMDPGVPSVSRSAVFLQSERQPADFEYLGPQLQQAWVEDPEHLQPRQKNNNNKNNGSGSGSDSDMDSDNLDGDRPRSSNAPATATAKRPPAPSTLRMDLHAGRDVVKVSQKGVKFVEFFTEPLARPALSEEQLEAEDRRQRALEAADADRVKGVPFSKAISRKDQVGSDFCLLPSTFCLLPTAYCLVPSVWKHTRFKIHPSPSIGGRVRRATGVREAERAVRPAGRRALLRGAHRRGLRQSQGPR